MRQLVLLSGGPDSALALKMACETGEPVVALHVNFKQQDDCAGGTVRWRFEQLAAIRLHDWFHHKGYQVDYVEADFVACCRMRYANVPMLGSFAAAICNAYQDIGATWLGMDASQDDGRMDAAFCAVLRAAIAPWRFPQTHLPAIHHPAPGTNWSKQQIREALGEELWALTISCRNPRPLTGEICRDCASCVQRSATHAPILSVGR
jgi:7-cyano-7-deazaguanine synthase in queuosine biosynthesis